MTRVARGRFGWRLRAFVAIVAIIMLGVAGNTVIVDRMTRPAEARDGGRIIETDVARANVRIDGEGPPLVLIHGFGAAIDWWNAIAPALAKSYRVIRLDLIGHGGTAAPTSGYSIERQAALVAAVLDKLGVERVSIVAHSMGGEVVTAFVAAHAERIERVVLIDTPAAGETEFSVVTNLAFTSVIGELLWHFQTDTVIRKGLAQGFAPGFAIPERFVDDFKQLTYTAFQSAHDASVAYRTVKPTYARLAAANPVPPLLAIVGSRDAIVAPATNKLYQRVPGAQAATIDGVGHSPMVEAPARTLELITAFLSGKVAVKGQ
jgi:pimeloyl-ACP methyl ester carboxylesterase